MKLVLPALLALGALLSAPAHAESNAEAGIDALVLQAREALRQRDAARLDTLRTAVDFAHHPLAPWVEYWELSNRLPGATVDEVEAFYTRWSGSYVEDRLRNDWLLELGRRRDWADFARDMPRFRMNDDREVTCFELLTRHLAGQDVHDAALAAWRSQREPSDGCDLLAGTLVTAGVFKPDDLWVTMQLAAESGRSLLARSAAALVDAATAKAVTKVWQDPARELAHRPANRELALLGLLRLAAADPEEAAKKLKQHWQHHLQRPQAALAWAVTARQAAFKLMPEATGYYRQAWALLPRGAAPGWSDDLLAWQVRAALRTTDDADRWALVQQAIAAMSSTAQQEPTWIYWRSRALQARAAAGPGGDNDRSAGRALLESIAGPMSFYGLLAAEDLGQRIAPPPRPQPPTAAERAAAASTPGFMRALQLIELGLRNEGVREWNFTLRGLGDRELLAAAQLACEHEIWDRCISSSDRTRGEVDLAQRFPMPFRREVLAQAAQAGLDPAYLYGLIRQESRFVVDAQSHAGAGGLMQIMPATARWTARKIGIDFRSEMLNDRDSNLMLGASYLKRVLDDFDGSQALAAAAYNAGPNRPRRWREGVRVEPAIWAENIPFNETRDYVQKVLFNAAWYDALMRGTAPSLKSRLGAVIGPSDSHATAVDRDLP